MARAVSLVRAWLYGIRGFVVMTISLAIAFSVAITGPPTNTEVDLVSEALSDAFADFGQDVEGAVVQLCPDLPPEAQAMLCARQRAEPSPAPEIPPAPPPVQLAPNEPPPPAQTRAAEVQLLGGPAPRARAERTRPARRATAQRAASTPRATTQRTASTPRATIQRASTPRRTTAQRSVPANRRSQPDQRAAERIRAAQQAAQGDLSRAVRESQTRPMPATETVAVPDPETERFLADVARAVEARRRADAEEAAYRQEQAESEAAWEERRRRWRERRRAQYEREYRAAYEEYYEEEAHPEEEPYPDDVW